MNVVVFVTNRISDMQVCNHIISLFLSKQKSLEQKRRRFLQVLPNAYIMLFLLWAGLDQEHDSRSGRGVVFGSGYKP